MGNFRRVGPSGWCRARLFSVGSTVGSSTTSRAVTGPAEGEGGGGGIPGVRWELVLPSAGGGESVGEVEI